MSDRCGGELRLHTDTEIFTETFTIDAGKLQVFPDVVTSLTTGDVAGALELRSNVGLSVTSRTYNLAPDGTFGQALDAVVPENGLEEGAVVCLQQLGEDSAFRTNLSALNMGGAEAMIEIDLFDNNSALVGSFEMDIPYSPRRGTSFLSGVDPHSSPLTPPPLFRTALPDISRQAERTSSALRRMSWGKEAIMKKTWTLFAALCLTPIMASANQVEPSTDNAGGKHTCIELCGCIDEGNLEEFLRTADVVSIEDVGTGITKPQRVTLRKDGHECRAIFKTVDISGVEPGYTNRLESVFTDRFTYEAAAYRLDRLLDIGLVPVTVTREIDGRKGSVQLWIENAIEMQTAADNNIMIGDMDLLLQRLMLMYVLDAMIYNVDRNFTNVLVRPENDDLFLIDHSRAFRVNKKLPSLKEKRDIPVPESVARQLRTLEIERLESELGDLLSKRQIRAIDSRRKLLVTELDARGLLPATG